MPRSGPWLHEFVTVYLVGVLGYLRVVPGYLGGVLWYLGIVRVVEVIKVAGVLR